MQTGGDFDVFKEGFNPDDQAGQIPELPKWLKITDKDMVEKVFEPVFRQITEVIQDHITQSESETQRPIHVSQKLHCLESMLIIELSYSPYAW